MISIHSAHCTQCGFCVDECPNDVFASRQAAGGGVETIVRYPDQCCGCGHCVAICPSSAVRDDEMPLERFESLPTTRISSEDVRNLLRSRRSIRAFQETPVARDILEQLLEAGIYAGSASNGQTERFIVIQDRQLLAELEQLVIAVLWKAGLKYLGSRLGRKFVEMKVGSEMARQFVRYHRIVTRRKGENRLAGMVFRNAPVVIVAHGLRTNVDASVNCALAARNMEVMARSLGLGTCWIGFLAAAAKYSGRIARLLGIPADRNLYSAIMVGYPKHEYRKTIPRRPREVRWI
jgi:nitroreductase/NAD-dependent dihydropyrimidine dehydrogenase PreA subunit